jgi:uncharacterized protein (DUF302 family)
MRHSTAVLLLALSPLAPLAAPADQGLTERLSPYPVPETIDRLEAAFGSKGVHVFARIDHSAGAQAAGLSLRPTQLLIFGNPKVGTPLMQVAPTVGLDLPMKVLAWQDAQGQVHVTWNTPEYLVQRHGLDPDTAAALAPIGGLIEGALK